MLPSACCFIVDSLTFSCRCSTLHVFGLHGHLQVCMMFHFYYPEGICFAAFLAFSCLFLHAVIHTWRWPCRPKTCSVEQRQLNVRLSTIKQHADGNITSKLYFKDFTPCRVALYSFYILKSIAFFFLNSSIYRVISVPIDEHASISEIAENNLIKSGIRQRNSDGTR
jgi:hypothetical protein